MERIITSIDQHGRMLIPSSVREKFNIHLIDEIHELFMKNHTDRKISLVDDFIARKRQEYLIEEARSSKNV